MYWSDSFTSVDIIGWILLSAKDPHTIDRKSLIENAVAYGRYYGVTKKHIRKALMLRLDEMILSAER